MSEVTQILNQIEDGDSDAAGNLLPLVYDELRKLAAIRLANEKPGQTLQATALVHDAYIRLVDGDRVQRWNSRGHFFAAAAEAMRRILIDRARSKGRIKRGGDLHRVDLDSADLVSQTGPDELLALDEALTELERIDPTSAKLVKLRYFAGLSVEQAAKAIGIPVSTAYREWKFARAWLHNYLLDKVL